MDTIKLSLENMNMYVIYIFIFYNIAVFNNYRSVTELSIIMKVCLAATAPRLLLVLHIITCLIKNIYPYLKNK